MQTCCGTPTRPCTSASANAARSGSEQDGKLGLIQGLYALCPYIAGRWPQDHLPSSTENNGILLDLHNNRGALAYGIILAFLVGIVIIGGIRRIGTVAGFIVPIMCGIYLLAGLYVMQQRGHIRIFILYDMVPRWLQRVFDLLSTLFICAFSAAVVYGGFGEAWTKMMRWETFGTAWDPPIPATMKPLIMITVVMIALQAVANLIVDWKHEKEVHDLTKEIADEHVD